MPTAVFIQAELRWKSRFGINFSCDNVCLILLGLTVKISRLGVNPSFEHSRTPSSLLYPSTLLIFAIDSFSNLNGSAILAGVLKSKDGGLVSTFVLNFNRLISGAVVVLR